MVDDSRLLRLSQGGLGVFALCIVAIVVPGVAPRLWDSTSLMLAYVLVLLVALAVGVGGLVLLNRD